MRINAYIAVGVNPSDATAKIVRRRDRLVLRFSLPIVHLDAVGLQRKPRLGRFHIPYKGCDLRLFNDFESISCKTNGAVCVEPLIGLFRYSDRDRKDCDQCREQYTDRGPKS